MSVNDTAAALPAATGGALPTGTALLRGLPLRFSTAALLWLLATGVAALWSDAADAQEWERTGEFASLLAAAAGLLATVPRLQEALGGIDALLLTNRRRLRSLSAAVDGGGGGWRRRWMAAAVDGGAPPASSDSLLEKYTVTNNAIDAVARALEVTGNPGLSRDNPLERHHRDVLCARVHAPQNEMILTGAGRAALAG